MRQQRAAQAALLLCLIFFFIAGPSDGVGASVVGRKHRPHHHPHHQKVEEKASAGVATVHRRGCGSKQAHPCGFLTPVEKDESLVDDDKRIVPTGPNPLHNR